MLLGSNVYVQCFVQAMDLPPQDLTNYEIVIRVDDSVDDALPSHGGETQARVSQSQVAELGLGSMLPASNSRKG
jgi:hypothetical protein